MPWQIVCAFLFRHFGVVLDLRNYVLWNLKSLIHNNLLNILVKKLHIPDPQILLIIPDFLRRPQLSIMPFKLTHNSFLSLISKMRIIKNIIGGAILVAGIPILKLNLRHHMAHGGGIKI
jgi:hypothetical protein